MRNMCRKSVLLLCCAAGLVSCIDAHDTDGSESGDGDSAEAVEVSARSVRSTPYDQLPVIDAVNPDEHAGGCWVYKDANYGGSSMFIPYLRDYNDLHRVDGFGDVISSAICDPDDNVWGYTDSNFGGLAVNLKGNHPTLAYNDVISSIGWGTSETAYCTFFTDSNWGGSTLTVTKGIDYNDTHRTSPAMGDNISSVFCSGILFSGDYPWVCKSDTWGTCYQLAGNYTSLSPIGYNNNISSIMWP